MRAGDSRLSPAADRGVQGIGVQGLHRPQARQLGHESSEVDSAVSQLASEVLKARRLR